MICISVTPQSRRLAKADLLNASRQGDLIELCLDHLVKSPDIADLVDAVEKPILITCRRSQDGGQWTGDEDQRLQLLRQANTWCHLSKHKYERCRFQNLVYLPKE